MAKKKTAKKTAPVRKGKGEIYVTKTASELQTLVGDEPVRVSKIDLLNILASKQKAEIEAKL